MLGISSTRKSSGFSFRCICARISFDPNRNFRFLKKNSTEKIPFSRKPAYNLLYGDNGNSHRGAFLKPSTVDPLKELLLELAESKAPPPVDSVLQRCMDYYDASGIGASWLEQVSPRMSAVCRFRDTVTPEQFPWQNNGNLLLQLR